MRQPIRILLQTTIPTTENDWHIGRFSLLRNHLASLTGTDGNPLFEVVARDREAQGLPDPVLSRIDISDFDELWLFAVDVGDGLDPADCEAIGRFRRRGGGLLVARDHMDLGCSVTSLLGVGPANHFHTCNLDPDESRRRRDDTGTPAILWPNFHSGRNGDAQRIEPSLPVHPVLLAPELEDGLIRYLPAHPHEGSVSAPEGEVGARIIATGTSRETGVRFNIAVAFAPSADAGPAWSESTFHHFASYNWDPSVGSPDFVSEPVGDTLATTSGAIESVHAYVRNLALWLGGRLPYETDSERRDRELDEALEESFPASDPPSFT
jgi:hypothetical protein